MKARPKRRSTPRGGATLDRAILEHALKYTLNDASMQACALRRITMSMDQGELRAGLEYLAFRLVGSIESAEESRKLALGEGGA